MEWEMQEPGWWTSKIGGVCSDGAGKWFFWPRGGRPDDPAIGPWKTLKEAKAKAATTVRRKVADQLNLISDHAM